MKISKLHGLGNDFLVALDGEQGFTGQFSPVEARALCDRHRGIGADGLIAGRASQEGEEFDLVMELLNADGSAAEMSGNGIRCLAHAVARQRGVADLGLRISTGGGVRQVRVTCGGSPSEGGVDRALVGDGGACLVATVSVSMGRATEGPGIPGDLDHAGRVATVDVGNPHLVIEVDDPSAVDLLAVGPELEARFPGGINIEFIRVTGTGSIDLVVWERGAGVTSACGTGAVASAHIANRWGLVGEQVVVNMPGGSAEVRVGDELTLVGPSVHIADIDVDVAALVSTFFQGGRDV